MTSVAHSSVMLESCENVKKSKITAHTCYASYSGDKRVLMLCHKLQPLTKELKNVGCFSQGKKDNLITVLVHHKFSLLGHRLDEPCGGRRPRQEKPGRRLRQTEHPHQRAEEATREKGRQDGRSLKCWLTDTLQPNLHVGIFWHLQIEIETGVPKYVIRHMVSCQTFALS